MKLGILLIGCASFAVTTQAHDFYSTKLTWTRDVSRIVYKRCVECHHETGTAFSLVKYEEARPWAKAIKDEVLNRRMPPWNAVKGFGDIYDDKGLSQEEISVIADWVEGGAPEGETIYAPPPPKIAEGMEAGPTAPHIAARVTDTLTLKSAVNLFGVRPAGVEPNASVQVIATRPDGSIVPLVWIKQANFEFQAAYYYNSEIALPAGSKIQVLPPGGGNFALYWNPAKPVSAQAR